MEDIEHHLQADDVEGAKTLCRNTRGPVASVCYQGLLHINQPMDAIERSIANFGGLQAANLEKGCSWIKLFIAMAPSLGFLGTVIGMVMAFDQIQQAGDIGPTIVAQGMKVALITTIFGIVVALILQLFYSYTGRSKPPRDCRVELLQLEVGHRLVAEDLADVDHVFAGLERRGVLLFRRLEVGLGEVVGHGLDRKTDPPLVGVDLDDAGFDLVTDLQHVLDLFDAVMAELGDVNKTVDLVGKLDERAELRDLGDLALDDVADLVEVVDVRPRIVFGLLESERNALLLRIDLEDDDFDFLTGLEQLVRVVSTSSRSRSVRP